MLRKVRIKFTSSNNHETPLPKNKYINLTTNLLCISKYFFEKMAERVSSQCWSIQLHTKQIGNVNEKNVPHIYNQLEHYNLSPMK